MSLLLHLSPAVRAPLLPKRSWPDTLRSSQRTQLLLGGLGARAVLLATCYLLGTPYAAAESRVWPQNRPHPGLIEHGLRLLGLSAWYDPERAASWLGTPNLKAILPRRPRPRPVRKQEAARGAALRGGAR